MLTERDQQIARWIGGLGAAGVEHVAERFEMPRTQAYSRTLVLREAGLLEHHRLLYNRPGLFTATRRGLRWAGIAHLPTRRVTAAFFAHCWEVARVAAALHRDGGGSPVLGELEFRAEERDSGQLVASVEIERSSSGRVAMHRPDLARLTPAGMAIAIEVELTTKSSRRLDAIVRALAWARHVEHAYYLAAPSTVTALRRAIGRVCAEDRVTVLALEDVAGIVAAEARRAAAKEARNVAL